MFVDRLARRDDADDADDEDAEGGFMNSFTLISMYGNDLGE